MDLPKKAVCEKVGKRVREIRMKKGLSIEKVALNAGIEYSQLSRIELGKINTSIYHVYKISYSLAVPLVDLLKEIE